MSLGLASGQSQSQAISASEVIEETLEKLEPHCYKLEQTGVRFLKSSNELQGSAGYIHDSYQIITLGDRQFVFTVGKVVGYLSSKYSKILVWLDIDITGSTAPEITTKVYDAITSDTAYQPLLFARYDGILVYTTSFDLSKKIWSFVRKDITRFLCQDARYDKLHSFFCRDEKLQIAIGERTYSREFVDNLANAIKKALAKLP